ncbi:MAG: glycine--tRNA ligase subunit beta, partial [Moraxellaceae bacterium]|nr:glycine--tRNA ligase subunit beta [Moraxellaceae bacterium]
MSHPDFLFEIGGEELPPKSLLTLATALHTGVVDGLSKAGITHEAVDFYAAPRRLSIYIKALAPKQADRTISMDGPPVKAAFDSEGKPTPAALGFARK